MDVLETDPFAVAIVLAATAAGDFAVSAPALGAALATRVEQVLRAIDGLRAGGREAAVKALVAASAPRATAADAAPIRARAAVAALAPREVGAAWMREAGAPRVGFRASAPLRATIACTEEDAWRA